MKILLTGSSGYFGKRLLPILVANGHYVICCVRDINRFSPPESLKSKIEILQIDLLDKVSLESIPKDIDGAFYLVHSMSSSSDYHQQEQESAENFRNTISKTNVRHVVYLSGIVNEATLSKHLASMYVDKREGRLLLFAEMKLPGEAWLEFRILENRLIQTATFRPWGLIGRLYWFLVLPLHGLIFKGMIQKITKHNNGS
jgi:nucleoside-diphosphate-sugar epimerase